MEEVGLTQFTIRILLLFLPGLLCSYVVDSLTEHKPREIIFFILRSFVFGFASYFLYWILLQVIHFVWVDLAFHFPSSIHVPRPFHVQFFSSLVDEKTPIDFAEIFAVCVAAVVLGLAISVENSNKIFNTTCRRLNITKKFGELDVWGFTFNLPGNVWVTVRDLRFDLMYDGFIHSFSDDGVDAELLLLRAQVYRNSTGELLYEVPQLYVSRDRRDITLEFRPAGDNVPNYEPSRSNRQPSQLGAPTERGHGEEGRGQHPDDSAAPAAAASAAPSTPSAGNQPSPAG